ncbi:SRPBCC family protein [Fertoebacter nigrum]|uniref:SRPBCC family protein n=1 Tax=Fertoeibacter niger TaxID=2656921 RepID=A0A8X8KNK7_9RHOB|nr:SRPBCC family protein [Fertoeibacter niger]NUB43896.1 SRPBCC family protein [Fertoeibacter niger]
MTPLNPELDLELTRLLKAPPAKVWRCWTEPELLKRWFTPHPVVTREAIMDVRPGGRFYTVMVIDGVDHASDGCFLAVEPERLLVFTDTLEAGFRPVAEPGLGFTAMLTFTAEDGGTRYTARAMHGKPESAKQHAEMGFHEGWGAVAVQLEGVAQGL